MVGAFEFATLELVGRIAGHPSDWACAEIKPQSDTGWGRFHPESDPTNVFEEPTMNPPRMCPNCGTEAIQPTFLYATLSVSFDRMQCNLSGLHAFRCDNFHIFLVFGDQKDVEKSNAEPRGSSIFL